MINEPVSITEAVRLVIVATIAFTVSFGWWSPTPEQIGAVLSLYAALSIVLSAVARSRSTPTAKVALTVADVEALNR